jgi:hypothetical protein
VRVVSYGLNLIILKKKGKKMELLIWAISPWALIVYACILGIIIYFREGK